MSGKLYSIHAYIRNLKRYDNDRGFNNFKSGYLFPYLMGLGIITILGCVVWIFKDAFVLKTDKVLLDIILRLTPCVSIPLLFLSKYKKHLAWVVVLITVWIAIISNTFLNALVVPENGLTGEGWITYYVLFFAVSLVANKQAVIIMSEILYTLLLIFTAEDFGGPISYVTKVMRPVTTGIIIDIGLMLASATIRSAFIKMYENEETLKNIAKEDMLTGLFNRHKLDDLLTNGELHRPSTIMILDIDKFKSINDTYGHMAGDDAIKFASNTLRKVCRRNDVIVRFGGDEFVIILDGLVDTNTIWGKIEKVISDNNKYNVTFSAGSVKSTDDLKLYSLIKKADLGAYYSKEHGRNRITKYEDLSDEYKKG